MKILDLFCGTGGWSKGFKDIFPDAEFYGVDVKEMNYPFNFIKADLQDWEPKSGQHYDIILASPPCTNFSQAVRQWTGKANESKGLEMVYRVFYLVEKIKPKFWIMENVKGLAEFLPPPMEIVRYGRDGKRKSAYLWGNTGKIGLFTQMINKKSSRDMFHTKENLPELAEIPRELAREVARCCL